VSRLAAVDRALLALALLVLASAAARFALSRGVAAPWIAPDEQLYGLLGRSLVSGDGLRVLGEPVPYYSLLYPLVVGLPFTWSSVEDAVTQVQALQALLMSATAIPVYLWTRPLAGARWALVASALTVVIPGLTYSGLLMSEALYYPAATLGTWALATCLRDPTLGRQALLLGAVAVALATRLQAVGFGASIVVAACLLAVSERSSVPLRRMWPTFAALGLVGVAWTAWRIALGGVGELLGAYSPLAQADRYSLADVLQSVRWQAGAVALVTIAIPLVALGVLAWEMLRGREHDPRVRALVATALAYLLVTVVLVGAFASRFVEHVTERQLLSVVPPVFVAFAVWLHRGLPRPQPATSLVAVGVGALTLLLPLGRLTTKAVYADAPSLVPLERASHLVGASTFEAVYALAAAALILLAVLLPRRAAPVLAGVVAIALAAGSLVASSEIREGSQVERERTFAGERADWIDASGADDVTLVVTGSRFWPSAWEALFWNSSIREVVRLRDALSPGIFSEVVAAPRPDGRLEARSGELVDATHVAAPTTLSVVGEPLATLPASPEQPGMVLWRATTPLTVSQRIVGLKPNGDLYPGQSARIRVFACVPGRLELTILGKEGKATRIRLDGEVVAERAVPPDEVWRPAVPAPASADGTSTCTFNLETDGLIGTTRVEFVRTAEPEAA
jgi:hypothetical protein